MPHATTTTIDTIFKESAKVQDGLDLAHFVALLYVAV